MPDVFKTKERSPWNCDSVQLLWTRDVMAFAKRDTFLVKLLTRHPPAKPRRQSSFVSGVSLLKFNMIIKLKSNWKKKCWWRYGKICCSAQIGKNGHIGIWNAISLNPKYSVLEFNFVSILRITITPKYLVCLLGLINLKTGKTFQTLCRNSNCKRELNLISW